MTDRTHGCVVVFKENMRVDDAEAIFEAIRQLRHVVKVEPGIVANEDIWAQAKADAAWRTRLANLLQSTP